MKLRQSSSQGRTPYGITIVELLVVLAVLAVVISMLVPAMTRAKFRSGPSCVNNLKQIGAAYRIWANDNGGRYPALTPVSLGGWQDDLTNSNQGPLCWTNYTIMANEMGQSPKVVACPKDQRKPATNFVSTGMQNTSLIPGILGAADFGNSKISYFVGVGASAQNPRSILGGDRNLDAGIIPFPDYGYSPTNGQGNDVTIPLPGRLAWSLKTHSAGNVAGFGNILFGDGSVQWMTTAEFRSWRTNCVGDTTNWPTGKIPPTPSIRLLFP
jgi:prepilin-type processing-associated H-X9-DG protein